MERRSAGEQLAEAHLAPSSAYSPRLTVHLARARGLTRPPTVAILAIGSAALVVVVAIDPGLLSLSRSADRSLPWPQTILFWGLIAVWAALLVVEAQHLRRASGVRSRAAGIRVSLALGMQALCVLGLLLLPGIHAWIIAVALSVPPVLFALSVPRGFGGRTVSRRQTQGSMSDAVFVLDEGGHLTGANAVGRELLTAGRARRPEESEVDRFGWLGSRIASEAHRLGAAAQEWSERRIELPWAGEVRDCHLRRTNLCDSDGSRLSSVLVMRDVSAEVATEVALRASEERLRILFKESPVGILVFDNDLVIQDVNERWGECIGCDSHEMLGRRLSYECVSSLLDACGTALTGEPASYSGPLRTARGEERWLECEVAPLREPDGQISGGVCLAWDVTEYRRREELIERLTLSDTVTGLPNRVLFRDRLSAVLAGAARSGRRSFVAILDVDGFSVINEALGHAAADLLLETIAGRLRVSQGREDTVARWGGDEFAVLATPLSADDDALSLCQRLQDCFAAPWLVDGRTIWLTASIGVAVSPTDGREAPELLSHAESALRGAKSQGDCVRFYAAPLGARTNERLSLASDLHRALEEEQLEVHYQPQVEMRDGRIVGCEALVRWRHPERGLIGPDLFIPLAEKSGLIVPIGKWVLNHACATVVGWQRESGKDLRLAVNLSARQLRQADLVEMVIEALAESGLPAGQLELEVTETAILADPPTAARALERIAALGVSVALDDFGTGYSSLAHLCELPIDRLKIDRSFVGKLPEVHAAAAVCRAVIDLAGNLGISVIAEGVETREQVDFLRHHGCDEAQGYLFGKAVPADEFDRCSFSACALAVAGG